MLIKRTITAFVLIGLVLAALKWLPETWFAVATAIIIFMLMLEWLTLLKVTKNVHVLIYLGVMLMGFILFIFSPLGLVMSLNVLFWLGVVFFIFRYQLFIRFWKQRVIYKVFIGIFMFALCWIGLNVIRIGSHGEAYVLILLLIIWGADTAAYFCGRFVGKHKLAPMISPGKTIEGLVGGLIAAVVIAAIAGWCMALPLITWLGFIVLGLITGMVSVVGDLFESMVKRQAGVKDSGNLLPGHGGLLDRLDSLVPAAPIFALGLILLGI